MCAEQRCNRTKITAGDKRAPLDRPPALPVSSASEPGHSCWKTAAVRLDKSLLISFLGRPGEVAGSLPARMLGKFAEEGNLNAALPRCVFASEPPDPDHAD
jgi:hypothetical protein